jgi:predicted nucleotidyltransferase
MGSLAEASLTDVERRALERFVRRAREEFGADLRSIWLFGSRARAEEPHPESDVDVLVVSSRASSGDHVRLIELMNEAADAEGARAGYFSVALYDPDRVSQRREIRSFFFQEVDRDKIVLHGEP